MPKATRNKHATPRRARGDELPAGGSEPASVREPPDAANGAEGLNGLYSSPEYLIRRAHQVATAAFAEACADLDLTSSQYAALFALRQQAGIGQNALGRLIALDRSTTSLVVKSLKERELVTARSDPSDRRKTFLELSDKGRLVLAQAEKRNARSSKNLMSVLDPQQAQELLQMLRLLGDSIRFDSKVPSEPRSAVPEGLAPVLSQAAAAPSAAPTARPRRPTPAAARRTAPGCAPVRRRA